MSSPSFVIKEFDKQLATEVSEFMISVAAQSFSTQNKQELASFLSGIHSPGNLIKKAKKGIILLGILNDSLIACGILSKKEISGVYVSPEHRRKGYGKAIVTGLIQYAQKNKYDHLWLDSTPIGFDFYLSFGFVKTGENNMNIGKNASLLHLRMFKPLK